MYFIYARHVISFQNCVGTSQFQIHNLTTLRQMPYRLCLIIFPYGRLLMARFCGSALVFKGRFSTPTKSYNNIAVLRMRTLHTKLLGNMVIFTASLVVGLPTFTG